MARLSLLNKFLESQKSSLERLKDDIKRLEMLKSQARAQPSGVFNEITKGVSLLNLMRECHSKVR